MPDHTKQQSSCFRHRCHKINRHPIPIFLGLRAPPPDLRPQKLESPRADNLPGVVMMLHRGVVTRAAVWWSICVSLLNTTQDCACKVIHTSSQIDWKWKRVAHNIMVIHINLVDRKFLFYFILIFIFYFWNLCIDNAQDNSQRLTVAYPKT